MGVELKILVATGVCLNIVEVNKNQEAKAFIEKLQGNGIHVAEQDNYGNSDGEARLIIYKDSETLMNYKVGFTPFEFLATQVYKPSHDTVVYGGARKYFAVELSNLELEDKQEESEDLMNELNVPQNLRSLFVKGYNKWLFSFYY